MDTAHLSDDLSRPTFCVLVVDDDERYSDYLRLMLRAAQRARFTVVAATSIAAGLRELAGASYDVCLLDYNLGTEDGLMFLRHAHARGVRVPIILLTAEGDYRVELAALAEGASDYLDKTEAEPARLERAILHAIGRHRADIALRLREARLAESEAFAHVMVAHVATDGRWLKVPPQLCAILGYTADELITRSVHDITHPDDMAASVAIHRTMERGETRSAEYEKRCIAKDKTIRWVYMSSSIVPATDREPAYFLTYIRDLTHQKQLEGELRQAQKMEAIGRLAGGVAHDFNNLLTAILGYAELASDVAHDPSLRTAIAEIQRAGSSAAALTRQLLAFSRKQVLQTEVLMVDDVVLRTVSLLRRVLGEDITVETVLPPGVPAVEVDQTQLEQVFLNLAVNAKDAMPGGGRLTIAIGSLEVTHSTVHADVTLSPGSYVTIAVQDTGCGMDAETKMRMFEPFFTTKQKDHGTGLGLSTVYGIVKQSGGKIGCETEPGAGTTFTIYLPATTRPISSRKDDHKPARGGVETVLLVEDDESVRALGRTVLEHQGYVVVEARCAEEAVQRASDRKFDLLLTDVVMPTASGFDLAIRLRRRQPELRVMFMSGFTGDSRVDQDLIDRIGPLLPKPFTPASLAAAVRKVLDAPVYRSGAANPSLS